MTEVLVILYNVAFSAILQWILPVSWDAAMKTSVTTTTFLIEKRLLEEDVDRTLIKKYLSKESWKSFKKQMKKCKEAAGHPCIVCQGDLTLHTKAIICEGCLYWHHFKCTSLTKKPKKHWFCNQCLREQL